MKRFELYGLRLDSDLAFPELSELPPEGPADVRLVTRPIEVEPGPLEDGAWTSCTPSDAVLWIERFAGVRVRSGEEIWVEPHPEVEWPWLRAYILGPIFGLLLLQRGAFALHASSVVIEGRAVAVSAPSGGGKSTLAAELHQRGHAFLADDVTGIRLDAEPPLALPGFRRIKLSPESLQRYGESFEHLPLVYSGDDKRFRTVEGPVPEPTPLARIYSLQDGPEIAFERMDTQAAFLEVMGNIHKLGMLPRSVAPEDLLERSSRIASTVPVFRLVRPRDLDGIGSLAATLEAHVVA